MNAHQRRKAYRRLARLKRDRVPVLVPPPYAWGSSSRRQGRVVATIESVQRHNGMAYIPNKRGQNWPRPVAGHNIIPVPRCWRGDFNAYR